MEVLHQETENKGRFYISNENEVAGEMTYSKAGDNKFIIDHTEVNDNFRGQNLGLKLVTAAVEMARKNNMKIMPLCPFAKRVFEKTAEFSDVLW
ncbi:GNAT family N-acetyltransferase [Fulvivirga lutimaris]|uniref:GNAT family N-acetyltransferase n=1 Tax=Fulvivirga lutimaris TaxID=1819566 RepID=UPI0012BD1B4C|nr:GNAT family N-acetyltransferase [Fulvivirga lutimaris]MTI39642.1 N-acetyltransferase [Fulvivirga lutimaris]